MKTSLAWLGSLVLVLTFVASGVLPLAWFTPSMLPTVLAEAELAFLLFLWPILLRSSLDEAPQAGGLARDLGIAGGQILTLAAIATPFVVLCGRMGGTGFRAGLASQAIPAAIAAGVATLIATSRRSGLDTSRPYYLAVVTLSAGMPLAGFVLEEVGRVKGLSLEASSPFHSVVSGATGAWVLVGALFLSAGLCAAWPRRSS